MWLTGDGFVYQVPPPVWDAAPVQVAELTLGLCRHTFTAGHCWLLARELSSRLGLPMWNVGDRHVVVGDGDWFLDVDGWVPAADLLDVWSTDFVDRMGPDDWRTWEECGARGEVPLGPVAMLFVVGLVIDSFGATPPPVTVRDVDGCAVMLVGSRS